MALILNSCYNNNLYQRLIELVKRETGNKNCLEFFALLCSVRFVLLFSHLHIQNPQTENAHKR